MMPSHSNKILLRALASAALVCAFAAAPLQAAAQQGGIAQYSYDKNGRLKTVALSTGETIIYEYDPAGNITAIRRISAAVSIASFAPREGSEGDQVAFAGVGFGAAVADNTVSFNGAAARVVSASATRIVAEVPDHATTGIVTITTPNGTAATTESFTVLAVVKVAPSSADLIVGGTIQFTAAIKSFSGDQSVRWSVNGAEGGDGAVGTISSAGLYAAPNTAPLSQPVKVRAASVAQPSLFGEADVFVRDPLRFAALTSVASVKRGLGIGQAAPSLSSVISVRRGFGIDQPTPTISSIVSVRLGSGVDQAATAFSSFVSATNGPNISSISPSALKRGATAALTIEGANLSGTTSLNFIGADGVIDAGVAASNISVNADGTQLTATATAASTAALGRRAVVISTPNASSQTANVGSNSIEIIAP